MTDWRQIQARIRKARSAPDALVRMTELFERTRDAMVAFELGKLHEKAGANEEAAKSFTVAFERFRRADWRKKAEEALVRLGAPVPAVPELMRASGAAVATEETPPAPVPEKPARIFADEGESQLAFAHVIFAEAEPSSPGRAPRHERPLRSEASAAPGAPEGKSRRRGRRGGRGRRRGTVAAGAATPAMQTAPTPPQRPREEPARSEPRHEPRREHAPPAEADLGPISIEAALAGRAKTADPALASRSAKLESQLRRLVAAAPHGTEDYDTAPAGPGVLLLSDSDLTTHYYVEACATLRVALRILVQGQRGRERGDSVRSRLAEHLGISESKVAKYLEEHCAIRWLQLDEGASHLAHFAVALLRPALNE